ncbi:MAG TPA: VOC family protein [Actinomycetota bacterium]|nr:VOC family protein [Actinomycetota bacterium]
MNETGLEIDHVIIAVTDLEASAKDLDSRFGLTAIEGGRHPSWGTANWIVPLGTSYLELVTVTDDAQAAASAFGRLIVKGMAASDRLCGWAVRTSPLERTAQRLHLEIATGSRQRGDGSILRWRTAGIEHVATESELPFFIEWGSALDQPSRVPVAHRAGEVRLKDVALSGDADRIYNWLGNYDLPISLVSGRPGLVSVTLTSEHGDIVISPALLS